jgi:oligosaccharide repeat unit polymerase
MIATLLLSGSVLSYLVLAHHLGRWHPCTWFSLAWTTLIVMHIVIPLGLYPINLLTTSIILVGLWSFGVGALAVRRPHSHRKVQTPISTTTMFAWAVAVTAALVYGVYWFQGRITAAVGVQDFSSLDPTKIRFAETLGGAQGGGIGGLMFSISPLVACLGLLGGLRRSRWWFMLVPVAFWASTHSPGRTFTLGLMAAMLPFYFYIRTTSGRRRLSRTKVIAIALATLTAGFIYFNAIGQALGKNEVLARSLGSTWIPDSLASPLVYQLGGMSALSKTLDTNHDPTAGEFGRSIFALLRFASSLGFPVHSPNTITDFVLIPIPFNVYTGFGDVWFDFGLAGVSIVFLALGALAAYAHARALEGGLNWAWASSMLLSVLASTSLTLRILYLDVVTQMALGLILFASITRAGRHATKKSISTPDSTAEESQPPEPDDHTAPKLLDAHLR